MILLNRGNNSTLNIFCDASITKPKNIGEKPTGCAGATSIIVDKNGATSYEDILVKVLPESTNNNSEVTAVLLGIYLAIKYNHQVDAINLFSDSKITIMGLREWIFNWVDNMENEQMYSSGGTPVANQDIICQIVNYILYYKLDIRLFHQKGHVTGTNESIANAKRVFNVSNYISLDDEEIRIISKYNDIIDNHTRNQLQDISSYRKLIRPIEFPLVRDHIEVYKKLIGRN